MRLRVLLTGSGGQVGTEFVRRASEAGEGLELLALDKNALDLTDHGAIRRVLDGFKPSLVVNAAAYTAVDRAEDESELAYAVNRDAVACLAENCRRHDAALIHFSTDYVFDGRKPSPYVEDDEPCPRSVYGDSKLQGEIALRATLPRHVILRVSWVFAGHGNNFVRTILRLANTRDELRIVNDQRGGPTYAGDIAEAAIDILRRFGDGKEIPWGTYHYAGAPAVTWFEFARCIVGQARACGALAREPRILPIATSDYPTRAVRPANSQLDGARAQRVFGLHAPAWREGLSSAVVQLAQHGA